MSRSYDAIVIGAGHNGLVTGAYLARAGLRTVILERLDRVGGALQTTELRRGFRVPTLAHTTGRLAGSVQRDLRLGDNGLDVIRPAARVTSPSSDGRALTLWGDVSRNRDELRAWSRSDALAYHGLDRRVRILGGFLAQLHALTPPNLSAPTLRDGMGGVRLLRALRGLDQDDLNALLRVLPMAVADFVAESFETDLLRAVVASRGVQYTSMGPWSAGSTAVLLSEAANNDGGAAGQTAFARGGPGAVADALASSAKGFGAEIRLSAEVAGVISSSERAGGVALESGEELRAPIVASSLDPKRTLLRLIDPADLRPSLRWRGQNLRLSGSTAKVNMALSGLPRFAAVQEDERLAGRILVVSGIDALERAFDAAKYGAISDTPYLEATLPSLADPTLAPDSGHVMSVIVQYTPYHLREGNWDARREALGDLVLDTLEAHAPGLSNLVLERQTITPLDLERDYGLTEGHPLHGEPGLDQFFAWRPLLGHASYRFALDGLYLCGAGAHPGGGVTGAPGANAAREIFNDWRREH